MEFWEMNDNEKADFCSRIDEFKVRKERDAKKLYYQLSNAVEEAYKQNKNIKQIALSPYNLYCYTGDSDFHGLKYFPMGPVLLTRALGGLYDSGEHFSYSPITIEYER